MAGWTHTPQLHHQCPEASLVVPTGRSIAGTAGVQCWRPASGTMACWCPCFTVLDISGWSYSCNGARLEVNGCLLTAVRLWIASVAKHDAEGAYTAEGHCCSEYESLCVAFWELCMGSVFGSRRLEEHS